MCRYASLLLARAGGEVKTAIVMGRTGENAARAREKLAAAKEDLRAALEVRSPKS